MANKDSWADSIRADSMGEAGDFARGLRGLRESRFTLAAEIYSWQW